METTLMAVTELLAEEFGDLPSSTVARVVSDCLEEHSNHEPFFIEQAAGARLAGGSNGPP